MERPALEERAHAALRSEKQMRTRFERRGQAAFVAVPNLLAELGAYRLPLLVVLHGAGREPGSVDQPPQPTPF